MNFANLHLEESVVLPENYGAIFSERKDSTPKLEKERFRVVEYQNDLHRDIYKERGPFVVRVSEQHDDNDIARTEGTLYYILEFNVENPDFAPFLKTVKGWAKKKRQKGKLTELFAYYLLEYFDSSPENDYELYVGVPANKSNVVFQVESETDFRKLLTDISNGFRALAAQSPASKEVEYDESDFEGKDYNELANRMLTPLITKALVDGLAAFRKRVESDGSDETILNVGIDRDSEAVLFYFGDEEKAFFRFKLGRLLTKCIALIEENGNITYRQALGHWFGDAAVKLPPKAYKGLDVSIEVPETGGDPVFENYE